MNRLTLILLLVLLPILAMAQAQDKGELPPPPLPMNVLQGGWDNNLANSRAAQWQTTNSQSPGNATIQWNWFRSEY
ncbi:MAG: hypothetical protein ABIY71_08320, partial [Flavobacteriales bacterium]